MKNLRSPASSTDWHTTGMKFKIELELTTTFHIFFIFWKHRFALSKLFQSSHEFTFCWMVFIDLLCWWFSNVVSCTSNSKSNGCIQYRPHQMLHQTVMYRTIWRPMDYDNSLLTLFFYLKFGSSHFAWLHLLDLLSVSTVYWLWWWLLLPSMIPNVNFNCLLEIMNLIDRFACRLLNIKNIVIICTAKLADWRNVK